jgi:hypothetical protein
MIIFFTNLHTFIMSSEFAITISFEFVQWTIVWVHRQFIDIELDKYESGPRRLFTLFSDMTDLARFYYTSLEKNRRLNTDDYYEYVIQPYEFMRYIIVHIFRSFVPDVDIIRFHFHQQVRERIDTWAYTGEQHTQLIARSIDILRQTVSDAGHSDMLNECERSKLNDLLDRLNALVFSNYESQNVRSPDIYNNFFTLSMVAYLCTFFILTTYRNCQQFTPLVAPVIVAIVFGPWIIGKVLKGPFAKNTMYHGNSFYGWRDGALREVALHQNILMQIYHPQRGEVTSKGNALIYDRAIGTMNRIIKNCRRIVFYQQHRRQRRGAREVKKRR